MNKQWALSAIVVFALAAIVLGFVFRPAPERPSIGGNPEQVSNAEPVSAASLVTPTSTPTPIPTALPTATPTSTPKPTATPTPTPSPTPILAVSIPTGTQEIAEGIPQQIDATVQDLVDQGLFSGAVLVAQDGQILLDKGYGLADRANDVTITPQTRFGIASLTKQFTAMAIMMLQDQGLLNVQDPACNYLASCPDGWESITIQELLDHTSGLPDLFSFMNYRRMTWTATSTDTVGLIAEQPLDFWPGAQWSYSNSGYVVLGNIIERVSGEPYGDFLRERIFEPLGMWNTVFANTPELTAGSAKGYNDDRPAPYMNMSILHAAGGIYSTVEDLYRWDQALYTELLLPQYALDEMFTPWAALVGSPWAYGYGYGWTIGQYQGHPLVYHNGLINGYTATIKRWPEDRLTVIILSNMENAQTAELGNTLSKIVLNGG